MRSYLMVDVSRTCMPNPWVSLRRDQLIPVKKVVNEKEQLEKGQEEEEKKVSFEISRWTIGIAPLPPKLPPHTMAGFDLTTHELQSFKIRRGRRYHYVCR
jgi:hypothetical protein